MAKYLLFFLSGFTIISLNGQAQIRSVSLGLSSNYSIIGNNTYQEWIIINTIPSNTAAPGLITTPAVIRERYSERVGFTFDSRMDYSLSSRFFISSGLGVSYLRFKRRLYLDIPIGGIDDSVIQFPNNNNVGLSTPERVGETSVWYLQLPMLAGITTLKEKIQIRAGMNFSYTLRATEYKQSVQVTGGQPTFAATKDITTDTFKPLQTSVLVEGSYLISKRFSLDVSAQSFLTPFYKDRKTKFNTVALGVRYRIK